MEFFLNFAKNRNIGINGHIQSCIRIWCLFKYSKRDIKSKYVVNNITYDKIVFIQK